MPSSLTVGASDLTTFVNDTTAVASEVNANFSLWRGHILPIDPTTSGAANDSYQHGSSDYLWQSYNGLALNLYDSVGGSIQLLGGTKNTIPRLDSAFGGATTSADFGELAFKAHTANTTGSYTFGAIEITTRGGPVDVSFQIAATTSGNGWMQLYPTNTGGIPTTLQFKLKVSGTQVVPTTQWSPSETITSSANTYSLPPGFIHTTLFIGAGTHTITVETTLYGGKADYQNVALVAREL